MMTRCRGARRSLQPLGRMCLGVARAALCIVIAGCGAGAATPTPPPVPSPAPTTAASAREPGTPAPASPAAAAPGGTANVPPAGPTLTITNPAQDAIWSLPGEIIYALPGNAPIAQAAALRVSVVGVTDEVRVESPLAASAAGMLTMPADKRFTGRRDLRFDLVGPDGVPLSGAVAIVRDVTIEGPR